MLQQVLGAGVGAALLLFGAALLHAKEVIYPRVLAHVEKKVPEESCSPGQLGSAFHSGEHAEKKSWLHLTGCPVTGFQQFSAKTANLSQLEHFSRSLPSEGVSGAWFEMQLQEFIMGAAQKGVSPWRNVLAASKPFVLHSVLVQAPGVQVGRFHVASSIVRLMPSSKVKLRGDASQFRLYHDSLYSGDPTLPEEGDLRVSFVVADAAHVSFLGMETGETKLVGYNPNHGSETFAVFEKGDVSLQTLVNNQIDLATAHHLIPWMLGFAMSISGFSIFTLPEKTETLLYVSFLTFILTVILPGASGSLGITFTFLFFVSWQYCTAQGVMWVSMITFFSHLFKFSFPMLVVALLVAGLAVHYQRRNGPPAFLRSGLLRQRRPQPKRAAHVFTGAGGRIGGTLVEPLLSVDEEVNEPLIAEIPSFQATAPQDTPGQTSSSNSMSSMLRGLVYGALGAVCVVAIGGAIWIVVGKGSLD